MSTLNYSVKGGRMRGHVGQSQGGGPALAELAPDQQPYSEISSFLRVHRRKVGAAMDTLANFDAVFVALPAMSQQPQDRRMMSSVGRSWIFPAESLWERAASRTASAI